MIPTCKYTVDAAVLSAFAAVTKRQREKLHRRFACEGQKCIRNKHKLVSEQNQKLKAILEEQLPRMLA